MALPATKNISRDRLSLARQALDGNVPNVADTAGPTPVGAIGGDQVLAVSRNIAETGDAAPTAVPDNYGEVTGTGIAGGIYGDPGAVISDETPQENPAMLPDEPTEGETPEDFDEAAADFNWSLLDQALQGVDTSEEEAQMQGQQDRMMGQALMDQRASMGASGFGESGAMMALEGDTRSDAARQLGLDISGLRREEAQRAIENAFKAQGIDIEKMNAAEQARLNELIASFMMNDGELPPEGGGEGGGDGGGDGGPGPMPPIIPKGTDQSETAAPPDPSGYETRDAHDEADLFLENYTDPDGKTWSVYRTPNGERYRVPMGA
jgi:hypothetical protein